jgi:putative SOS response-associated peptidase YedK
MAPSLLGWLRDLGRREPRDRDSRIYPWSWAPVICVENGQRLIRPMRYLCRPAGKPATYDTRYPGTYNARRDSLEGYWRAQFGHTHGLLLAHRFFEHVEAPDGLNRMLEFMPRDGSIMLIACL